MEKLLRGRACKVKAAFTALIIKEIKKLEIIF
jgi:hypothetical protein